MRHSVTFEQFEAILKRMPNALESAVIRGLRSAAARGKGEVVREISRAKPYPAVDSSGLRQSVTLQNIPKGSELFVDSPHAPHLEHGTRPFWPPAAPLILWLVRKGIAEDEDEAEDLVYAFQATIATYGIEPRFFFQKAMTTVGKRYVPQEIRAELKALESRGL